MYLSKKTYKTVTESNKVKFIVAKSLTEARIMMYQLVGSENFTIKTI